MSVQTLRSVTEFKQEKKLNVDTGPQRLRSAPPFRAALPCFLGRYVAGEPRFATVTRLNGSQHRRPLQK